MHLEAIHFKTSRTDKDMHPMCVKYITLKEQRNVRVWDSGGTKFGLPLQHC